ncbi:MAG: FKBP-type peptidyl-prolyl cis-trans isomerase [Bacteroidales bacterium]|nr:FKBP-type peptidyl-prolyl cis-trans isomerase [Bacteroidales bacterium]
MKISKDKIVSVIYELKYDDENGEIIEKRPFGEPMTFIFGSGKLLKDFEANLEGLEIGNDFSFKLTSEQAYGSVSKEAIVELPKNMFIVDGKLREDLLKKGSRIPMKDNSGNRIDGTVIEVNKNHIKMDFNHPLAGEDLFFRGKVSDIRDATKDELNQINSQPDCSGCNEEQDTCSGC